MIINDDMDYTGEAAADVSAFALFKGFSWSPSSSSESVPASDSSDVSVFSSHLSGMSAAKAAISA